MKVYLKSVSVFMNIHHFNFHIFCNQQVLLINAVKDVASALADLISATKNASGKITNDPTMNVLKDSAKVDY